MPYHEFTTRGFLHRRSNSVCGHFDRPLGIDPESELAKLVRALKAEIGPQKLYDWASALPGYVLSSEGLYADRIREKLAEIMAVRAPQQPTQLFLFRLTNEYSSSNSVAQEAAGVTILEQEEG